MKVVILAGGFGSRISEESIDRPKPLIEIDEKPILWHIMKIYSHYGYNDFIICCGYKGHMIKNYFQNFLYNNADIKIDLESQKTTILNKNKEKWNIILADTGQESLTGKRIKMIKKYVKDDENFLMTYGDGVGNINIKKLVKFHLKSKKLATLTAVKPLGRYGILKFNKKNLVESFQEKPKGDGSWINGGFYVLNKKIFNVIEGNTSWESKPLMKLLQKKQLIAFSHKGFWKALDTVSDKNYLNNLIKSKSAPWKMWKK